MYRGAGLNKVVSTRMEERGERTYHLGIVGGPHPAIPERAAPRRALALLPGGIGGAGHPPALVLAVLIRGGDAGGAASATREGRGDWDRLRDGGGGGRIRVVGGQRGGDERAEGGGRARVLDGLLRCRARRETACARAVEDDGGGAGRGDGTETGGDTAGRGAAAREAWGPGEGGTGGVGRAEA